MKANLYDGIVTLIDISLDLSKKNIPKGMQGTIVECYENPEGYSVDLAIPDSQWVGGFDYENVILTPDQFAVVNPVNVPSVLSSSQ
jgi:hypothetical protein